MYRFQAKLFLINNFIIAFLWLMLLGISQQAKAADTIRAKVNSYQIVDACGKKTDQVLLAIDLGKIVKSDSLFACNFQLSYDSTKLKMHSGLYINTLAEFFDFQQVGFLRSGKIIGVVAANFSSPQVTGDLPLIAFLGDYLTSCRDSAEVKIDYLEFTDEFKRPVSYQSGYVIAEPNKASNLYVKVYPKIDTSKIELDSSGIDIAIFCEHKPDTAVSTLEFYFKIENSKKFKIISSYVLNSEICEIESNKFTDDSLWVKMIVKGKIDGKPLLNIKIIENFRDSIITSFKVVTTKVDECACATKKIPGFGFLTTEVNKDTTDVDNQVLSQITSGSYNQMTDEFMIRTEKSIQRIEIYSILGERLYDRDGFEEKLIIVPANELCAGWYIAIIEFFDKRKEKKILIKI
jgi:hypothetical protein